MNGRLLLISAGFVLLFAAIGLRLVDLGLGQPESALASSAAAGPQRADLLDRHGRVLATTVAAPRVVADPRRVRNAAAEAKALASVLIGAEAAQIEQRLASPRHYVVIKRDVSLGEIAAVRRLGLPSVSFEHRTARVYPNGRLAAHLIGFVDVDNKGLAGAERAFDARLSDPHAGPVRLSLDLTVQAAASEVLAEALERYQAVAGSALVIDVRSGELLAGVSLPDFDPHRPAASSAAARKDLNVTQVFELGSVFKLFNVAMALDAGTFRLDDRLDISRTLRVGGFPINDFRRRHDTVTVAEALLYSSNIANAKIALRSGAAAQRAFLERFGLDRRLAFETGNVAPPLLPRRWREVTVATVAFGHGIAVTPLQFASAAGGLLGPGHAITPTLLRREAPVGSTPVVDPSTVRTMRGLAYRVALEGSGRQAQALVPDYLIGGKTGTAEKVGPNGRYLDGVVRSSFLAALPIDDPAYVVFVMLDEPTGEGDRPDLYFASWTAAPTAGRMIARLGPLLGLAPSAGRTATELFRLGGGKSETAHRAAGREAHAARPTRG